jgi:transcriptional regulator of arginine metabolism
MKMARHSKIIQLIGQYDIETQEELASRLNENGYGVTQATVSRDIRELKLTKITKGDGRSKYAVLQDKNQELGNTYIQVLKAAFSSMDLAENILVIKTAPGMAMAAAAALDDMGWTEIVGSIAGDNTIMCAIRSVKDALAVMEKLKKMLDSI